jgi:hypothetical protein
MYGPVCPFGSIMTMSLANAESEAAALGAAIEKRPLER